MGPAVRYKRRYGVLRLRVPLCVCVCACVQCECMFAIIKVIYLLLANVFYSGLWLSVTVVLDVSARVCHYLLFVYIIRSFIAHKCVILAVKLDIGRMALACRRPQYLFTFIHILYRM